MKFEEQICSYCCTAARVAVLSKPYAFKSFYTCFLESFTLEMHTSDQVHICKSFRVLA